MNLKCRWLPNGGNNCLEKVKEKDGKGILPDSVCFSTDLHSLGQFVQEGKKVLFETNLYVDTPMIDLTFPNDEANEDGMNYLVG